MRIGIIVKKLSKFTGKKVTREEVKEEVENSEDEEEETKGNIVNINRTKSSIFQVMMSLCIAISTAFGTSISAGSNSSLNIGFSLFKVRT